MTWYVIDQTTNELLYVSEFDPPNEYAAAGHSLFTTDISANELNTKYQWDKESNTFVVKPLNIVTKRDFIKRFTVEEYTAVKQNLAVIPQLDYYWQLFMLAEFIDLNDTDTITGVSALEMMGLLGTGRAQQILNNG